jgi:hypothetical protein
MKGYSLMKTLRLTLLAMFTCTTVQHLGAQVLTGPITNSANGHWYYLLEADYWTNAEAQAVQLGGHLVTINDAAENAWVLNTFGNYGDVPRELHIGFTDQGHEGQWVWTSGEPVTYQNWAPGEPNNGMGIYPYENYAIMYAPTDPWPQGSWNDMMGSLAEQRYWGVVEVSPRLSVRVSQVELCWPTVTNVVYQIQYRTGLSTNTWVNLGTQMVGIGSTICVTNAVTAGLSPRLYRVVTVP